MHFAHLALAAALTIVVSTQVGAQSIGDWRKGRALARQLCAECHALGRRNVHSPNPEAPSFATVASTPGMTASALNVFFQTSHRHMPNLVLATDQRSDIIAYIMMLKK